MGRFIDLTGQKFGRLSVIHVVPRIRGGVGHTQWSCLCDCGVKVSTTSNSLRGNKTKSCGCWNKEVLMGKSHRMLPSGVSSRRAVSGRYKREAYGRGLSWELSELEFDRLVQGTCNYCGQIPEQSMKTHRNSNGVFIYNGIDRIDNLSGYTLNNCVTCCGICNWMKSSMKLVDFLAHIEAVHTGGVASPPPCIPVVSECRRSIGNYKRSAKQRKLAWAITDIEASNLITQHCNYCNQIPRSGIDRVDSTLGYTSNNVVPACRICNRMKREMSETEFRQRVQKIVRHRENTNAY